MLCVAVTSKIFSVHLADMTVQLSMKTFQYRRAIGYDNPGRYGDVGPSGCAPHRGLHHVGYGAEVLRIRSPGKREHKLRRIMCGMVGQSARDIDGKLVFLYIVWVFRVRYLMKSETYTGATVDGLSSVI